MARTGTPRQLTANSCLCCRRRKRRQRRQRTFSSDLGENLVLTPKWKTQLNLTYGHKNVCVPGARHTNREKLGIFYVLYWIGSPLWNLQTGTFKRSWGCNLLSTWMQRLISHHSLSSSSACWLFHEADLFPSPLLWDLQGSSSSHIASSSDQVLRSS